MIALTGFLSQFGLRPNYVLHVGANTGAEITEYIDLGVKGGLYIEPVAATYAKLCERLEPFEGHTPVKTVVTDRDGEMVRLKVTSNSGESTSILDLGSHADNYPTIGVIGEEEVSSTTIDSLLRSRGELAKYDLWVIDVQGAELLALKGGAEALRHAKIVMTEIHDEQTYIGAPHYDEVRDALRQHGFTMKAMHIGRTGFGDAIFVRDTLIADQRAAVVPAGLVDVARGKPCRQSSLSPWSMPNDAGRAVDGNPRDFAFHTAMEDAPWWEVDLGEVAEIEVIRVYNREGHPERAATLYAAVSLDGADWTVVHENRNWFFGGSRDGPLDIRCGPRRGRYVRLGLRARTYFHLEQVNVYANPPSRDRPYWERPE